MSIFWAGFGLEINGMIEGVCVYGQPSPPIQKYAFKDRDFQLYELSRPVIQSKERNAASFLVSHSLQMLTKPSAVISYADTELRHCGIVYQATNWIYTGPTVSHDKMYIVNGNRVHPMTLRDQRITDPTRWAKENDIQMVSPSPKHRYFYFNGDKREVRKMKALLQYPVILEYPKLPKSRYDDGDEIKMPSEMTLF